MLRLSSPGCISDFKGDVLFIVIALHVAQLRSNIHVAHSAGHMPDGRSVRQMQMADTAAEGFKVVVEGNCDDRGTISYNIALGEKRANEVKAYYTRLGIAAENIAVVSYGEEKPVCYEATQSCWAKNRRADTVLIVK